MREFRHVNLVGATGKWRNETFDGREFLVVPVVALVEGVVHAANAPAPELVPAAVFTKAPGGWDGEPVTWDHPKVDGEFVSANSPEMLKAYAFGQVFNSHVTGDRLRMEAWLDLAAAALLPEGQAVVDRVLADEVLEVSVGAWIIFEAEEGTFMGKRFAARWTEVTPDHLALLPVGIEGACSVEMGCGAGRVMRVTASGLVGEPSMHLRTHAEGMSDTDLREMLEVALHASEPSGQYVWVEAIFDEVVVYSVSSHDGPTLLYERGWSMKGTDVAVGAERTRVRRHVSYPTVAAEQPAVEPTANRETDKVTTFDRTLAAFAKLLGKRRDAAQGGLSDAELRDALDAALHQAVPGYQQIVEVFPDTGTVVYAAAPGGEQLLFMSRAFKAAKDGTVTVDDASLEVKPVTRFEPLEAGSTEGNPCGCTVPPTGAATPTNEDNAMNMEQRIAALVECPHTAFSAEHVSFLETLDEAGIAAFEEAAKVPDPVAPKEGDTDEGEGTTKPDADKPDADKVSLSRAEYNDMRAAAGAFRAQETERKAALVANIRQASGAFTEEELADKDVEELEKLADAVNAAVPEPDYGGRPVPRVASSHEEPPRIFDLALAKRKQG